VHLFRTLRAVATSAVATTVGLTRMMMAGDANARKELKPGDVAPDFSLEASDGRTYRLNDLLGRGTIVVAWFPKAFTGG
jgi:cytochrome oxidase Cu insertion factor (SCO1/SenC/PrrC family)